MTVRDLGDDDYDVVVVGAGPAGISASTKCAREGLKTLLVDRRKVPSDTYARVAFCGKGSSILNKEGIDIKELGREVPIYNISLVYPNREPVYLPFGKKNPPFGYRVQGRDVEEHLLGMTPKNLDIVQKSVTDAERKEGKVILKLSDDELVKAKILIDASGSLREPSRMLGKPLNMKLLFASHGYRCEGCDPKDFDIDLKRELTTVNRGGPLGNGIDFMAMLSEYIDEKTVENSAWIMTPMHKKNPLPNPLPFGFDLKEFCKSYTTPAWDKFEELRPKLKEAKKTKEIWTIIPSAVEEEPYGDNLLMVGDAARQGLCALGDGMVPGLVYGIDAAYTAISAIENTDYSKQSLQNYKKRLNEHKLHPDSILNFLMPRLISLVASGNDIVFNAAKPISRILDREFKDGSYRLTRRITEIIFSNSMKDAFGLLASLPRYTPMLLDFIKENKSGLIEDIKQIDFYDLIKNQYKE